MKRISALWEPVEILWERRCMAARRRAMAMLRAGAFLKLMLTCHAKLCLLARLVALRWPLYYHAPSLVQHTGRVNTSGGGGFHTASDFVEDWVPG